MRDATSPPTSPHLVLAELVTKCRWRRGAELGVLRGRTVFYLLEACPALSMVAVDAWLNKLPSEEPGHETYSRFDMAKLRREFFEERQARNLGHRLEVIVCDTAEAASIVRPGSLDFVFVDATHTADGVRRDVQAWRSRLRAGGRMLGHDHDWPSVRQGLADAGVAWEDLGESVWGERQ